MKAECAALGAQLHLGMLLVLSWCPPSPFGGIIWEGDRCCLLHPSLPEGTAPRAAPVGCLGGGGLGKNVRAQGRTKSLPEIST